MLSLISQERNKEEKVRVLREQGIIPAILYGPKNKPMSLKVGEKEFEGIYKEAGASSLINLEIEDTKSPVLIREVQRDPLRGGAIHIDFYQPPLNKEIEVMVPLVFEGEAPAVKDLGGTLMRNIQEVEVRALPQNLPHEIIVDISGLTAFGDKSIPTTLFCAKFLAFSGNSLPKTVFPAIHIIVCNRNPAEPQAGSTIERLSNASSTFLQHLR